jgi:hypothetical protein
MSAAKKPGTPARPGELRVWWIPQVPGEPFHVPVGSLVEALFVMDTLGRYDAFQLEHYIKPDYSNVGGLECYSQDGDDEWCEWYDPETGDDINDARAKAMGITS